MKMINVSTNMVIHRERDCVCRMPHGFLYKSNAKVIALKVEGFENINVEKHFLPKKVLMKLKTRKHLDSIIPIIIKKICCCFS